MLSQRLSLGCLVLSHGPSRLPSAAAKAGSLDQTCRNEGKGTALRKK